MRSVEALALYRGGGKFFDKEGILVRRDTRDFLRSFMEAFERWVDTHS